MSAGGSPPKPWERATAGGAAFPASTISSSATAPMADASGAAPALPARTDALNAVAARTASAYSSPYNRTSAYSSAYGTGAYGGMSSYSSPYSRFGGMGGMGGMYGGGYGGMGGYGMGGYGGGMYGAGPGMYGPNGEQSLTQTFSNSTQATFQMIESIVGAFGGFAQMLESTYMATHSSFFAMVSVAEQLGTLRQTMGSILGIFALMRWIRSLIAKLTGRPPPASSQELTVANFAAFTGAPGPDGAPAKPSRKPFIFFVLAAFGLPYLMGKLIKSLASSQEAEQQRQLAAAGLDPQAQPIDPSKLDFCRVLYDYTPQAQPGQQFQEGYDISVKKGDLVAVLSKTDPAGQPSDWWRCRARDGGVGYLPSPYLETIQRRPQQAQIAAHAQPLSEQSSRVNTMTTNTFEINRTNSLKEPVKEKVPVKQPIKPFPEIPHSSEVPSVEHFQRGGFYS